MKPISRGYLTLNDSDIRLDPWSLSLDGGPEISEPEHLADWSYYQSLTARVTVVADADSLRNRLALGKDAVLGIVIIWVSSGTSLRGSSKVIPIKSGETSVRLDLERGTIRGDLKLECQVMLVHPSVEGQSQLAPSETGAIVWSSAFTVRLEGLGARMPVLAAKFSKLLPGDGGNGLWWLQILNSEMTTPAESALWFWVNEENSIIEELLSAEEGPGAQRTQHFMKVDLYRQLVTYGITDDDFSLETTYPAGSLGAAIAAPIRLLNAELDELRARFRDNPRDLEAEIQSRLGGL
jgi:hypothetical protein